MRKGQKYTKKRPGLAHIKNICGEGAVVVVAKMVEQSFPTPEITVRIQSPGNFIYYQPY